MKKILTILLFSLLLPNVTNNGAEVSIAEDVIVTVTGDLILNSGNIDVLGDLYVSGDILENGGTISGTGNLNDNSLTSSGCIDELACNYDENAYIDDDSCDYSCYDNGDYSLSFDGVDDNVVISDINIYSLENVSVGIWAKKDWNVINSESSSPVGYLYDFGDLRVAHDENGIVCHSGLCDYNISEYNQYDNEWIYLTFISDQDGRKIYINGNEVASDNYIQDQYPFLESIFISSYRDMDRFLNVSIKEFIIFSKSLSQEEIINQIDITGIIDDESIIAHYKFNAGEGTTLYDHSGNQNHGIINGAEWVNNIVIGDVIQDGNIDILDIIALVDIIVNVLEFNPAGDLNDDGVINVLDVFALLLIVLNN